ncbi:MAG TPA: thermonuclease family protein [Solirubrobacterales bacterium]|nr:thermonuclease family protein [Solirubrobacterales bacterium]
MDRRSIGSAVLIVAVAALLIRPWEGRRGIADAGPASASAYVARAIDGDTIEVHLDGRLEDVRYIGVDTPETVKPGTPIQCFGERASRFDKRLVTHRRARLVFGVERRDVYGRLLAYVYLGHRFVNAELVRRGLARTLAIPPNTRFAGRFARLQRTAARLGRGLWGAC